jgi:hypothetical protein
LGSFVRFTRCLAGHAGCMVERALRFACFNSGRSNPS